MVVWTTNCTWCPLLKPLFPSRYFFALPGKPRLCFRQFVISSLGQLRILDGIEITDKEREEATKTYGRRRVKTQRDAKTRKIL